MMVIEVNRAAVAHVAQSLQEGPGGRGVRDLDIVLSRLLDGTVDEVALRVERVPAAPAAKVPAAKPRRVSMSLRLHMRAPNGARPTGRPVRQPLQDLGGYVADGQPVLPAMLRSLEAFPAEVSDVLVRCLGLGREPMALAAVAEEMGVPKAVVASRLNGALRQTRGSFAWAERVEEGALAATGRARLPLAEMLGQPWAAGLGTRALELLLPRVTGEVLRVRGHGDKAVAVRRDRMRSET